MYGGGHGDDDHKRSERARRFRSQPGSDGVVSRYSKLMIGGEDGLSRTPAQIRDLDAITEALQNLDERAAELAPGPKADQCGPEWDEVLRGFRRLTMTATASQLELTQMRIVLESAADASLAAGELKLYALNVGRLLNTLDPAVGGDFQRRVEFRTNQVILDSLVHWRPRYLHLNLGDSELNGRFCAACVALSRTANPHRYFSLVATAPYPSSRRILELAADAYRTRSMHVLIKAYLSLDTGYVASLLRLEPAAVIALLSSLRPDLAPHHPSGAPELKFRKPKPPNPSSIKP